MKKLSTAIEVAEVFGVAVETVRIWARNKIIPSIKVGYRTLRFDMKEVRAALGSDYPLALESEESVEAPGVGR